MGAGLGLGGLGGVGWVGMGWMGLGWRDHMAYLATGYPGIKSWKYQHANGN